MQVQLKVESGGQAGKLISINKDKFLIGRSDECHLRPKSESVSRRHCAIVRKEGRVLLIDLKSRNGTTVNDKKLDPSRAKVLKDGDKIRVGKLAFTAVIEAGIANVKKSAVKDVKEAASRSAETTGDSRYEEVDVSSWLEEADQFERREGDPVTRQFQIGATRDASDDSTAMELDADSHVPEAEAPAEKRERPKKQAPGKLPTQAKKASTGNSKDAATDTLRKFFSGR